MSIRSRSARIGACMLVVALVASVLLFKKDAIGTMLMGGKTISAVFDQNYKVRPNGSPVKVGFVKVGKVSDVRRNDDGTATVSMKVDEKVLRTLGPKPSATIRSATLLGGNYFVDLAPGGGSGAFRADSIPRSRTQVAVELDKVAGALQPDALAGAQKALKRVDASLKKSDQAALRRLLADAPDTLEPGGRVLDAAQGRRSDDLTKLVSSMESTGRVLTQNEGQLDSILTDLNTTSRVFSDHSADVQAALKPLPSALSNARAGLADLNTTLVTTREVSGSLRPAARDLDTTLTTLRPTLKTARPVISDARVLVEDARPLIQGLDPVVPEADKVVDDVRGPVLKRLNGPVTSWLYQPYKGSGVYSLTSSKRPTYEEAVFAFVNLDRASSYADQNGNGVAFQPGVGAGTAGGLVVSPEQLYSGMTEWLWPESPLDTVPPLNRPGGKSGRDLAPLDPSTIVPGLKGDKN
ncbi:MlaD family protein [Nocardioides sp. YJ-D4]